MLGSRAFRLLHAPALCEGLDRGPLLAALGRSITSATPGTPNDLAPAARAVRHLPTTFAAVPAVSAAGELAPADDTARNLAITVALIDVACDALEGISRSGIAPLFEPLARQFCRNQNEDCAVAIMGLRDRLSPDALDGPDVEPCPRGDVATREILESGDNKVPPLRPTGIAVLLERVTECADEAGRNFIEPVRFLTNQADRQHRHWAPP